MKLGKMLKKLLGSKNNLTSPTNNKTLTSESKTSNPDSYNMPILLKNNPPKLSSMKKKLENILIS